MLENDMIKYFFLSTDSNFLTSQNFKWIGNNIHLPKRKEKRKDISHKSFFKETHYNSSQALRI